MSEFLDIIERYASGVDTGTLFAGDGRNLSESAGRRVNNTKYVRVLARFEEAFGSAVNGHRASRRFLRDLVEGNLGAYRMLGEAVSTSDFPYLFGDTIDRVLLAKYVAVTPEWRDYMKVSNVPDFRDVKRFRCTPGRGILPTVAQGQSYSADKPSEQTYSFGVQKRGSVRNIFWESLVNDDLGALSDTPSDFARAAQNTEYYVATSQFAANTTLYATTHAVNGTNYSNKGTAALTAPNLALAISAMGNYPGDDDDSTPIMNEPIYIVVGTREMQFKAEQILNSVIVTYTGAADAGNLPTANILPQNLRSRMQVRYNPFLRLLDANYQTSWYLFADPGNGFAVEVAFLSGYEAPQLFMRAGTQMMLGGGLVSPMEGGFDNDAVDYKVRHVIGGSHTNAVGGWRFTYMSDGTGA